MPCDSRRDNKSRKIGRLVQEFDSQMKFRRGLKALRWYDLRHCESPAEVEAMLYEWKAVLVGLVAKA